jgi:hypothetical protein
MGLVVLVEEMSAGYLLREAAIYHSHQFDYHRGTNPLSFTLEVNMVRITKQGCFTQPGGDLDFQ